MNKLLDITISSIFDALLSVSGYNSLDNLCSVDNNVLKIKEDEYNLSDFDRVFLFAFGKAACDMSLFFIEKINIYKGVVASNKECKIDARGNSIEFFKSSHPLPDYNSVKAADRLIELSKETRDKDLVIFLISGGASSIVEKPKMKMEEYVRVIEYLINGGFSIDEINLVRKGLSKIKGGKILREIRGTVLSFVISDVVGDDLSVIGSGLTYFDEDQQRTFHNMLKNVGLEGNFDYDVLSEQEYNKMKVKNYIVGSNSFMAKKLCFNLKSNGFDVLYIGSRIEGEVSEVANFVSSVAKDIAFDVIELDRPSALVFGGESKVEVFNKPAKGGRNQHLALLVAKNMVDVKKYLFVSFATDGKDGNSDFAGAWVDDSFLERVKSNGLVLDYYLKTFNSALLFDKVGGGIKTFNTKTNVADIGVFVFN